MMDYEKEFSNFFIAAADAAGRIALKYFRKEFTIDDKQDKSPVTQADKEIEAALRAMIETRFPDHGIMGEEFGNWNETAAFTWVIDPIDGTKSFAMGRPLFGTVIGLMHDGAPVAGLIDQPFTRERWWAFKNAGAYFCGTPVRVAQPRPLEASRLFAGNISLFEGQALQNMLQLGRSVKWPQYGCDCYAYGLLAMGCADLVVENDLKWHDIAGLLPIITEAGGVVQSWSGQPLSPQWDGTFIAATDQALADSAAAICQL